MLAVTGIESSPCPLEDLNLSLNSITLNEMQFAPEEQLSIGAKGIHMPAPQQAWSTKAFFGDGQRCRPTGDEVCIRMVEAVPMRVMFEEKSDPTGSVDVLSHSEIDQVLPECGWVCMTEELLGGSEPRPSYRIPGTAGSW